TIDQSPVNLVLLSVGLRQANKDAANERLLRRAWQRYPADFWINFELASALGELDPGSGEAIGFYRAALALRPQSAAIYNNLGSILLDQGKLPEAVAADEKAIQLNSDEFAAYGNLGNALMAQGKFAEAEAIYRKGLSVLQDRSAQSPAGNNRRYVA